MPRSTQHKARKGIPIPSFSLAPTEEVDPGPPMMVTVRWKAEWLLQIEGSLQIHFRQSRKERSVISFDEFYALVRGLSLEAPRSKASDFHVTKDEVEDLSVEELALYDLLCAASPSMYKAIQVSEKELGLSANDRKVWCIESRETPSGKLNRMQQFRALLKQTQIPKSKSIKALQVICAHQESQKGVSGSNSPKTTSKTIVEPCIRPGMTLEERVRAREEAKKERENISPGSTSTSNSSKTSIDMTWLRRLADGLWSHARHILLRQSRIGSPTRTQPSKCIMTLKDAVAMLSGCSTPGKTAYVPTYAAKGEKVSQRRIVRAIQEMERLVPEWITLMDPEGQHQGLPSKGSTIWIHQMDYKTVRARLGGRVQESATTSSSLSTKRPSSGITKSLISKITQDGHSTPTTSSTEKDISKLRIVTNSLKKDAVEPFAKRQRVEPAPISKRKVEDAALPPSPVRRKKSKGLRINKNLILSDADYNGGEIIEPTAFESPRGLKRLFCQMNAGERI